MDFPNGHQWKSRDWMSVNEMNHVELAVLRRTYSAPNCSSVTESLSIQRRITCQIDELGLGKSHFLQVL